MKHILFVVGPALGHVSRCLTIARELTNETNYRISFAAVTPGYGTEILQAEFPIEKLSYEERGDIFFADGLEKCIEKLDPDIICVDLTPMKWLTLVRFPKVSLVYITNFFLTKLCDYRTIQEIRFKEQQKQINTLRQQRGLYSLTNIKDLYELGNVLLCDPIDLVDKTRELPSNYYVVGPCFWEPEIDLPAELSALNKILFISLGSTGRKKIPQQIIDDIVSELNIKDVVWLGAKLNRLQDSSAYNNHYYSWLPASQMLSRSKFVISQGGAGSTYQALTNGVPCGIWPSHKNQEILGLIVQDRGYGLLLDNSTILENSLCTTFKSLNENTTYLSQSLEYTNGPLMAANKIIEIINN